MLANRSPLVIFPAMNPNMLQNPAVRANIETIRKMGHKVVDPDSGMLACGYEGKEGSQQLCDLRTYGMRLSKEGPERYEGHGDCRADARIHRSRQVHQQSSSGKMGYAIAKAAWYREPT